MRPMFKVMSLQYGQVDAAQLVQILSGERAVQGALEFAEDHAANQLPAAPDGRAVERCSTHAFKKALARAGIEREFRWHDLRHTWASWYVQSGTRLQELMELGSWSSYEMVLRYAHLATDHLRDAASRIDDTRLHTSPDRAWCVLCNWCCAID